MSIIVKTLSDQTYEVVRRRILSGGIAPGTPVRQDVIATDLGVSKIPVREALGRLEQDGLLTSYPNRGYVVRSMSMCEASEIFALRLKLEPGAVADGAGRAGAADHRAARTALEALEKNQDLDGADHVTQNRLFHLSMIQPAGPVTFQLLTRLLILSERYVRMHLEPKGREDRAKREHRAILEAWTAGDALLVEGLIREHIQATLDDLREQLGDMIPPSL
ncbi:MAG: GntR family transcriptional regulator [Niveispirillum sp.]|uniref:GntR family transcriptional regulator n=1 Tax=Niveispirillum sp. TaxID=1917217 RepID=UPI003BA3F943